MINTEAFNQDIRQWSQQTTAMMRKNIRALTNSEKHKLIKNVKYVKLYRSISYKNIKRFGEVERIIFPFAKHGFFLAVGASRKHPYKSNPRKRVEWYNFVFEDRFEELAYLVANYYADQAMIKAGDLGYKELK